VLAVEFNEEMVGFYFCRMGSPDVGHNLINQIGRDIDGARRMHGLDFCPIGKFSTVTNMNAILGLYWLLGSSVQKQALRGGERSPSPACKHRMVGVQSDVVNRILMFEQRYFHVMEKLLVWPVF
jgi:hypothetical protein